MAGERYVKAIMDGKISACKWVRKACQRHLEDKQREGIKSFPYKFARGKAEKVIRFVECFHHVKGRWGKRRDPFILEPWQCFMVMSIFGWVRKDNGMRRFRKAMLVVPRKNGKSPLAAAIGLYMFAADGEHGAEVYSGATSEDQAWEVFRPARLMAMQEPDFVERYGVEIMKSNLHIARNGSRFEPIIGKPGDGASPSCAIVDEYHEHDTDDMFDTMETGMVGRQQPLMLIITTAGDNIGGPCHSLQLTLQKVLEGVVEDDTLWGIVYTIDEKDDWALPENVKKANPNYGVSVEPEIILQGQTEAIRESRKQGVFQTKHENVWMGARHAFFNLRAWQQCQMAKIEDCKGFPLYAGLDLASTKDIAALALLFDLGEGRFTAFGRYYIPDARLHEAALAHYAGWHRDGWLIATQGNLIDYRRIESDILNLHSEYGIRGLGFDPAYAQMMAQRLSEGGIEALEIRQNVLSFSEPMKLLDAEILDGLISHEHSPPMAWMMSNVVAKMDNKDGVYPNKQKPELKIDGPVALIIARHVSLKLPDSKLVYTPLQWV